MWTAGTASLAARSVGISGWCDTIAVMAAHYFLDGHFTPRNLVSGACFMCGATTKTEGRNGIVQLHQDEQFDYIICNLCAEDIGRTQGMASLEKADELRHSNRRLGGEVKRLKTRISSLSATVTAFLSHEGDET